MLEFIARSTTDSFRTSVERRTEIEELCRNNSDVARFLSVGRSEEGREIYGVILGNGRQKASLIAGSHADEPVGPETLRTLIINGIKEKALWESVLNNWTFCIIPQINPDGEARNVPWMKRWPSLEAYLSAVEREPPGRDLEFGYPDLRVENAALTRLWEEWGPFNLHISFHGMGYSEGALLLIERHWIDRTGSLRESFLSTVHAEGLGLHDHNRNGEKGFYYIGPGFTTTPEGRMMKFHFESSGDAETAALFRDSSMEWIRSLGGDPLCLVTELPLFVLEGDDEHEPGVPALYNRFKSSLPGDGSFSMSLGLSVRPLPVETAVRFHLRVLEAALACAGEGSLRERDAGED